MITVIFATRDRSESLERMLQALIGVQPPAGGWKLVVVDNGSRDSTAAVLARFAARLPLTMVHEPVAGKNRALNRALPQIEGDLAVFTDDDVIPDHDWLIRLQQAAASQPEATIFGGTVTPLWPDKLPRFISERAVDFKMLFACNEHPAGWCKPEIIFGPNMAVRTSVFNNGFAFSENIGPNNSQQAYVMGSETDFVLRLGAAGYRAWFAADSRVQHIIRPEQLTEQWILKRYYLWGIFIQRKGWARGPGVVLKRILWSTCAVVARMTPPSQMRLRVLSRDRLFAGVFAAGPIVSQGEGQNINGREVRAQTV